MADALYIGSQFIGFYPPTYASEILYDENTTEKEVIDEIKGSTFSESKTSNAYGAVETDISISKKLYGYYMSSYLLLPYAKNGYWNFIVADLSGTNIVVQPNKTGTLVVYHSN